VKTDSIRLIIIFKREVGEEQSASENSKVFYIYIYSLWLEDGGEESESH
jgi:hypothetical protein